MNKKRIFGIWYRINETALYFYITVSIISFSVLHLQSDPTYSISPADHFSIIEARSSVKWGLLSGSKYDKCCVRNSRHYANKLKKLRLRPGSFGMMIIKSYDSFWRPSERSGNLAFHLREVDTSLTEIFSSVAHFTNRAVRRGLSEATELIHITNSSRRRITMLEEDANCVQWLHCQQAH